MKSKIYIFIILILATCILGTCIYSGTPSSAETKVIPVMGTDSVNINGLISEEKALISSKSQPSNRNIIDGCHDPSLWRGIDNNVQTSGVITIPGSTNTTEAYRKYDGFLKLQNYLYLKMNVTNFNGIEEIDLCLADNLYYTDSFRFDLMHFLSEGDNTVIINRKEFTADSGSPSWDQISTIIIVIKTTGISDSTVTLSEISTYDAYPMCSIWFDDGWKSTYTAAYPLMKEKNFKGILSVVSSQVEYPDFCSETELNEMYQYGWDFVNHTSMHEDITVVDGQEAEKEISEGLDYLVSRGFTRACCNFVPPYSSTNDIMDGIISKYAATSRADETYNYLPVTNPYHLGYMEVTPNTAPATVKRWIDDAAKYGLWLVLLFHSIESPADADTKYEIQNFKEIINYLDEKRSDIKVVTLSELLDTQFIAEKENSQNIIQSEPQGMGAELVLAWEDNFDNETLNQKYWNFLNSKPSSNNELQTYQTDNVNVADGYLKLICSSLNGSYFSGAVTTENKQLFQYGKIEIRAKFPSGKGIFPAIWMLPQSGDSYPEIDILEYPESGSDYIWNVMHYSDDDQIERYYKQIKVNSFDQDFHTISLEWSEKSLIWSVDEKETFSIKDNIPKGKMFIIINAAIGGDWPGNPDSSTMFPQTMLVDYIKYYIWE